MVALWVRIIWGIPAAAKGAPVGVLRGFECVCSWGRKKLNVDFGACA